MDGLEDALQKLLADPKQLSELAALASSLVIHPPVAPAPPVASPPEPSPPEPPPPSPPPHPPSIPGSPFDGRQERLLLALKPFLKPSRQQKLDRALRLARLTHLAGGALRGGES